MKFVDKLDAAQERHRGASVAVATFKKFSEDRSTTLATAIAFWAFFSIFPLLLVAVTVLGWVLSTSDKVSVLTKLADMFPLLDPTTVTGLTGSWWPVLLGSVTALWSGLGVIGAMQTAFNSVWEVPHHRRPGKFKQVGRSLWVLATVGAGLVVTTLLSSLITGSANGVHVGVAGDVAGYVIAVLLDVGLVLAAFRILTEHGVTIRDVLPGAVLTGVVFFILQELSAFIISGHLKSAQSTYGHFATVITILWWFYLQSVVTLLGAQLNVVLKRRLYPRSLVGVPRTEADRRALQAYAEERTYHPEEVVRAEVASQREGASQAPTQREGAGQAPSRR